MWFCKNVAKAKPEFKKRIIAMETPKVFISYSWHPKENQIRVEQLVERLFSDGVHCVIDIYDLQDGQDKNIFMEKMVNDPSVKKVLLICNKEYTEKANARKGGVGIESTIVSEEIYNNAEQTKFIPVIFEYDEKGKPYLPTFVKSRIFVDLSTAERFNEGYDQLLRDIYDKPLHKRPTLGSMPTYLKEEKPVFLPTTHKVETIKQAILSGSSNVQTLIQDYLDLFLTIVPDYKINKDEFTNESFITKIDEGIDQLMPLKNDFINFVKAVAKTPYCKGDLFVDFFEKYFQMLEDNEIELPEGTHVSNLIFDHIRYFNYDWFLSICQVLLDAERFDVLRDILKSHYCVIRKNMISNASDEVSFMRFQSFNYTLNKFKNTSYDLRRVSIQADYIKNNASLLRFDSLVKTDLLLYYLSLVYPSKSMFEMHWYPDCSIYNSGVEVLPKLASVRYFEKAKVLFDVNSIKEYKEKVSSLIDPNYSYDGYHSIPSIPNALSFGTVATIG